METAGTERKVFEGWVRMAVGGGKGGSGEEMCKD